MFKAVVQRWLTAGVVELGRYQATTEGTPQGGVISPLLANTALDGMERLFHCESDSGKLIMPSLRPGLDKGVSLARYADGVRHITWRYIPAIGGRSSEGGDSWATGLPDGENQRGL